MTRERVVDAAERLFLDKGFRATSVQDIGAAAGYTTGAIYSNFKGKDDLFVAVFRRRADEQERVWREARDEASAAEDVSQVMGNALSATVLEPAWYAAVFEFLSYAARDEELRHEVAEIYSRTAPLIADILRDVPGPAPLPLDRIAPILAGLMRGLAWSWFVDPEDADPSLFSDAIAVLLGFETTSDS